MNPTEKPKFVEDEEYYAIARNIPSYGKFPDERDNSENLYSENNSKNKILKSIDSDSKGYIEQLCESKELEKIFPELAQLKNLAQPKEYHSEGDVLTHTLILLDRLPQNASLRLKLAGMLHDIGKADTQKIDEKGKITFHGHAQKGFEKTLDICKRLDLPEMIVKDVSWLVRNHMFYITANIGQVRPSTLEKKFLEDEELGNDLIALFKADVFASLPEKGEPDLSSIDLLIKRIEQLKRIRDEKKKEIPPLVTGKDLIDLDLEPGPEFSKVLEEIREAQLNGKIKTKENALGMAKNLIK